jgi:hypothetical protein
MIVIITVIIINVTIYVSLLSVFCIHLLAQTLIDVHTFSLPKVLILLLPSPPCSSLRIKCTSITVPTWTYMVHTYTVHTWMYTLLSFLDLQLYSQYTTLTVSKN